MRRRRCAVHGFWHRLAAAVGQPAGAVSYTHLGIVQLIGDRLLLQKQLRLGVVGQNQICRAADVYKRQAKSFARIFYRNSINIGLPIMECPEAVDAIEAGDTVRVDFDTRCV